MIQKQYIFAKNLRLAILRTSLGMIEAMICQIISAGSLNKPKVMVNGTENKMVLVIIFEIKSMVVLSKKWTVFRNGCGRKGPSI